MADRKWEHFAHGADIGIRGFGPTKAAAFEEAARALAAVVTEPGLVAASQPVELTCAAPDDDILLLDWLNGLIYEMAERRMLFGDFRAARSSTTWRSRHRLTAAHGGKGA